MTDQNAPVRKHIITAREHLAGVKAARVWIQELSDLHLLKHQDPISKQPVDKQGEPKP